jgi:acyl-coenzyme A synthetase/AMP-(fatty) acid ligase
VATNDETSQLEVLARWEPTGGNAVVTIAFVYKKWVENRASFWAEQARRLTWDREWDEIPDNTRHPLRRLHEEVVSFAGALTDLGLRKGDTVLLFLPATPQSVIAMVACARLGLVQSVVVTSVPASVLRDRIDDARPAVVLTASGGFDGAHAVSYQPVIEAALDQSLHAPLACVVLQRPDAGHWHLREGRDLDWDELVETCTSRPRPLRVPAGHPPQLRLDREAQGSHT